MLEKKFAPEEIEKKWYAYWESQAYFTPNLERDATYCISIPPPNVTGYLHMGHAFQDTLMDTLIRYHRMQQKATLWQVGTDHAGIATQMVVERQLNQQGQTKADLGREKFLEEIWRWKKHSGGKITEQLRTLGASVDWQRERFTMDEGLSAAVQHVFIQLYEEGLIYQGHTLVNWDPILQTAVSDIEVITEEKQGHLWHIRYTFDDSDDALIVATTRPETLLGDAAIAVHPDDPRYQKYLGQYVRVPFVNRKIPIIADAYVDPSFGTGCVKITPAHDFNDYAVGQRHNLPLINILNPDATLNDQAGPYEGLDRFVARKRLLQDLVSADLLVKTENHALKLPVGDRSGAVIEPYLTKQWFVKTKPLAEPALQAVQTGQIRFVPQNWEKTYFNWLNNIEDWCISRQLWWGHRIPIWYDTDGKSYVGTSLEDVRQRHNLAADLELTQDPDVLDTWFSSALWPFSTLGWPDSTQELDLFYPNNVLVTGFDIIFFWVARMIMFGLKFTGQVPFREVYVHGLIQDQHGQKMSKSKGNVLDPLDLIYGISLEELLEKRTSGLMQPKMAAQIKANTRKEFPDGIPGFGTDALRLTLCALATQGRHIRFELGRLEGYRNFCNKLWNAARYVLMNTTETEFADTTTSSVFDDWIIHQLTQLIGALHRYFESYRFDLAAQALYDFIWHDYCDWYLEFTKPMLTEPTAKNTRYTLLYVLETVLRALHPIMPFITEDIWQRVAPRIQQQDSSIMQTCYPAYDKTLESPQALATITHLQKIITALRTLRAEMNIAPKKAMSLYVAHYQASEQEIMTAYQLHLMRLANLDKIVFLTADMPKPLAATAALGTLELLIPMEGLIDHAVEKVRLQKNLAKLEKEIAKSRSKLQNDTYLAKAPAAVVEKEKNQLQDLEQAQSKLTKHLHMLEQLS